MFLQAFMIEQGIEKLLWNVHPYLYVLRDFKKQSEEFNFVFTLAEKSIGQLVGAENKQATQDERERESDLLGYYEVMWVER